MSKKQKKKNNDCEQNNKSSMNLFGILILFIVSKCKRNKLNFKFKDLINAFSNSPAFKKILDIAIRTIKGIFLLCFFLIPFLMLLFLLLAIYDLMNVIDPPIGIIEASSYYTVYLIINIFAIVIYLKKFVSTEQNKFLYMFLRYYAIVFCPTLIFSFIFTILANFHIDLQTSVSVSDTVLLTADNNDFHIPKFKATIIPMAVFLITSCIYIKKHNKLYNKYLQTVIQIVLNVLTLVSLFLSFLKDTLGSISILWFVVLIIFHLTAQICIQCASLQSDP